MPRKMISVAFVLALLVLTSGAAQARPAAVQPAPAGLFEQLWQWAASSLAPIFRKDGTSLDPNGLKKEIQADDSGAPKTGAERISKRQM